MPGAVLSGPASAHDVPHYFTPFSESDADSVNLLTQHYYRADGESPASTVDLMLSPDPHLQDLLRAVALDSHGARRPFRIAECNNFYNGGAPDVSNSFASALWAIDFMFAIAQWGASGVNFHGGGESTYTPIANNATGQVTDVRPNYYALFLMARMVHGEMLETAVKKPTGNQSAYAVRANDNSIWLVINNKEDHSRRGRFRKR